MDCNDNRSSVAVNPWPMTDHDANPKKSRGGWFSGTPHKDVPQGLDDGEDLPLLKLTHFTKKVMVCFDTVRTGTSRTRELLIENPCDFPQELRLEKFPADKGFSIPEKCWELDGCELMRLSITWTPKEEGNAREMATFKCEDAFRLQVILLGTAEDPPKKRGPGRRSTFSVHRKAPLKATQPNVTLKPSRPTMILKPKGPHQKSKQLGKQPRPSTGRVSKENQENRVPVGTSVSRLIIPGGVDDANEPRIILCTPSPMSGCERSPCEEFAALDSSLAEINGDGMPMTAEDLLLEKLKRQTLTVCNGVSPLLQTTKPFVFPKAALPQAQSTAKSVLSAGDDEPQNEVNDEDLCGSPKRLSIEAKTTVTKNKASDTEHEPSVPANVRKNLFSSSEAEEKSCSGRISSPQEFEDSLIEPRFGTFPHDEDDDKASNSSNDHTESCTDAPEELPRPVENHGEQCLDIDTSTSNGGSSSLLADIHIQSQVSSVIDEPFLDSMIVPSSLPHDNSAQLDAETFKVHTSVITSRLTSRKRVSDPKDEAGSHPKKLRPEEVKTQVAKKQQPRDRTTNRTLALRKAAAVGKTAVTAAKAKVQGRSTKQYKAKGPMKGVPMAKLNLLKHNGTAIPRHPMPFAAKNMFYDERWMEKQERGFTRWLNHVLTPDDCPRDPSCKATKIDAGTLCVESASKTTITLAPSKEDLSLRAYTAKRKLNRLRRGACMLFQSEPIVRVIQKLEAEIEKRRIVVRLDRKLHADYGIKQKLLDLFLSYNPLWLRIGLETTYGEILPIHSNTDVVGLSRFVITRLLGNPDIAAQYAHPTVPHLYGPGYEEVLSQFTLRKFLVLVFFLDRAKLTRLIDHDPCLFCKDSEFKSSRDILLHFSREYLRGEGDLTRHLSFMGYSVTHRQTALDEFDFSVTKLATDLRCGVRLARVVELLIHDWTLSSQLRVPAISRLQKIHNVEITLTAMKLDGGGVDARAIVDGHREKTLELLWRIIFQFQIGLLLNEKQIKEEITFLRKNLCLQKHLDAFSTLPCSDVLTVRALDGRRDSNEPNVYFKSERLSLLLKWCQVVCSFYRLKVENFTVAFSDGRALCYLVHHYHPSLLPLSLVHQDTTQTQYQTQGDAPDSGNDDSFDGTWSNVYSPSTGKPGERDKLLANERDNFKVLYDKVSELGGVPGVVKSAEMSNTIPDEKVVITYVSYLCARLLDLRTETRAARTIQMVWKAYRLRQLRKYKRVQEAAAQTIQYAVRSFLTRRHHQRLLGSIIKLQAMRRHVLACREVDALRQARLEQHRDKAATSIQACVRGFLARRHYQKTLKVIVIQSGLRGYIARRNYLQTRRAIIMLQAAVRCRQARDSYKSLLAATLVLQQRFRALRVGQFQLREYNIKRGAVITLQAWTRGVLARRQLVIQIQSAVSIQAAWKMHRAQKRYLAVRGAAQCLQNHTRAYLNGKATRINYLKLRETTVLVQSRYRAVMAQRKFLHLKASCIAIQSFVRMHIVSKRYREIQGAAVVTQRRFRAKLSRNHQIRVYNHQRSATIILQAWFRGVLVRRQIVAQRKAAIQIQTVYKAYRERQNYKLLCSSTVCLQRYIRAYLIGRSTHSDYLKLKSATVIIQASYCALLARRTFLNQKQAAVKIQSVVRMQQAQSHYFKLRQAVIIIQTRYRALKLAQATSFHYQIYRGACITLQAGVRGFLVRKQMRNMHEAAIQIQKLYRSFSARTTYLKLRNAAAVLQTHWRATMLTREVQQDFISLKKAALVLQSAYRGKLGRRIALEHHSARTIQSYFRMRAMRQLFQTQKQAAIKIQSAVRMHQAHMKYTELRRAAVIIQTRYHAQKTAQAVCLQYQISRGACITLQAGVRGFLVRQQMHNMHKAAIQIQKCYRSFSACTKYHQLRNAAAVLQTHWRATMLTREVQQDFISLKKAAVVLQSAYRGKRGRRIALEHHSARTIQSYYRMHAMRQLFQTQKQAAIKIQSAVRMHQAHITYTELRRAAVIIQTRYHAQKMAQAVCLQYRISRGACITLQAGVRGFLVRKQMRKLHEAAVQIQKSYRSFTARTKYHQLRNAAAVLQKNWRATRLAKEVHQDYVALKKAAVVLQSAYRGKVGRHIALEHYSARVIQSYFRMHLVRHQYQTQKQAAIKIQSAVRMHQAHIKYTELRRAAVIIQTRYHAQKTAQAVCLQYQISRGACITLQAGVRGFLVRQQMHKLHEAAVQIQKSYRLFSARTKYHQLINAATVLQTHWRTTRLTKEVRQDFVSLKKAAVVLQSAYRGKVGRHIALEHYSARVIQSYFRMHLVRHQYQTQKQAAIKIQSAVRMHQAHIKYTELRRAVVIIQTRYHAQKMAQAVCLQYRISRGACITLQAGVRGFLVRKQMRKLHEAAVQIQKSYRSFTARTKYHQLRNAAAVLQKNWRATRLAKEVHQDYVALKKAAVVLQSAYRGKVGRHIALEHYSARVIQSYFRMHLVRHQYQTQKQATIKIQSAVRMHQAHIKYTELRRAAVIIQTRYHAQKTAQAVCLQYQISRGACITLQAGVRGFLVRQQMHKLHEAAVQIQKSYRLFSARTKYHQLRNAATVLQTHWRTTRLTKEVRQDFVSLKKAAVVLQSAYRGKVGRHIALEHYSARVIQSYFRMHLVRHQYQTQKQAAIKIQSAVRMHQAHIKYTELRRAAVIIQTRYHAQKMAQAVCLQYQISRGACITLQAGVRGFLVRQHMRKLHEAAVQIQKSYRSFSAHTKYHQLRNAAAVLQTNWRATRLAKEVHHDYVALKKAAVVLQSAYRGKVGRHIALEHYSARVIQAYFRMYLVRHQYQTQKQAAIKIQSAVRMHQAHIKYTALRRAAVIIQTRYHAQKTAQAVCLQYRISRGACITLQAGVRGFLVRQQMHKLHEAAVQIQKSYRLFSARTKYHQLRNAATVLQTHWRTTRLTKEVRQDFVSLKKAAVVLQSAYRGKVGRHIALEHYSARVIQAYFRMHLVRHQYGTQKQAAIKIQSAVRMHQAHMKYTELRRAAVIIQTRYHAQKTAQAVCLHYRISRGACITLQAGVRGFLVRKQMRKLHEAAVQIQKSYRSFTARTKYHQLRNAAAVLQTHWRTTRLTKEVQQDFVSLKKAAVVLQSAYRGNRGRRIALEHHSARTIQSYYRMHAMRQLFQTQKQAAIKIQSAARMHQAHIKYTALRRAAVIIQTRYHAQKMAQAVCLQYQISRGACITLQAGVRGFLVRKQMRKLHEAAVQIQKSYRSFTARTKYHQLRNAAAVLQTNWRATRLAKEVHQDYVALKKAAVVLQSAYRGKVGRHVALEHYSARVIQSYFRMHLVRQQFQTQKQAALKVQSAVRMHQARSKYTELRQAVIMIQTRYRATKLAETTRIRYHIQRGACITIQAYVRGYLVRQHIHKLHAIATNIQKNYRAHYTRTHYLKLKQAASILQKYLRATKIARKQQLEYIYLKKAAISIQSMYRGGVGRKIAREHRAARLIQSVYRMHVAAQEYTKLRAAAITIQSLYRTHKAHQHYRKIVSSALAIQQFYRGHIATKATRNDFLLIRSRAVKIQAAYRGFVKKRSYTALKQAATKTQALYRGRRQHEAYQSMKRAAIVLQGRYRARVLRNQVMRVYNIQRGAAITIQAAYKAYTARKRYIHMKQAVTTIQASYRGHKQKTKFLSMKKAATILQTRFRAHLLMREAVRDLQAQRKAATAIQAMYRAYTTRKRFTTAKSAAIVIQAFYRGTRQRVAYQETRRAATVLQTKYRAHLLQREATRIYHIQRGAAITIQAYHRGRISRQFVKRIRAAIKIQSYIRMLTQRRCYQALRNAADKIGANFKARKARRYFLTLRHATRVSQTRYRALITARAQQRKYNTIRGAAIMIQSFFRGHKARKLAKRIQAAVKIQTSYRGYVQQRHYQTVRKSISLLQAQTRGMIARREFAVARRYWQAAVCIQSHFRGYTVRRTLETQRQARLAQLKRFASVICYHLSSIQIQRCYRLYKMRQAAKAKMQSVITIQLWMRAKLQRLHFLKLRRGIVVLQHRVRQHQAERHRALMHIQAQTRVWLARRYVKKMKAAAVTLQSVWRGRQVRHSCKDKKIAAIRARCVKAYKAVTEEKKLCNRTTSALDYLLKYRQMSGLLEALISLDVVSRLSAACCLRLVESQAVPVIFTLIKSCNRSLPCMEVIKYSVNILLNLTKYSPTAHAVFEEPEFISIILDLMQMYREKGTQIFAKVCMLMGTMCQDPRRAQIILSAPKNKTRLLGINRLTERKYSMEAKRTLVKSRGLNSSSMSRSFLSTSVLDVSRVPAATPRKQRRVQPDWVMGRGKMREITDPLEACHFVMDVLKLK